MLDFLIKKKFLIAPLFKNIKAGYNYIKDKLILL